jgi:hypothetical protein
MSKDKKAKAEVEHCPLPYSVRRLPMRNSDGFYRMDIMDANDCAIAGIGVCEDGGLVSRTADFLAKAANDHAKLHQIACGLTKSRDAALKDADRLRALVRRFMGIVNNYPPIMSAWALLDAEEQEWRKLSKEQQAAMVPEGYKRLSALMRDAYAAVGPEEVGE